MKAKSVHVLKYYGVTKKDEKEYDVFHHESARIPWDVECIFPQMLEHSLHIDFDIDMGYSSYPYGTWIMIGHDKSVNAFIVP